MDETDVVECAEELLRVAAEEPLPIVQPAGPTGPLTRATSPALGGLASIGIAVFPKCPICWASYMSMFGISGLVAIPYSPWLQPVLFMAMALNAASVWWRCHAVGRMMGFHLVAVGAITIVATKLQWLPESAAMAGVISTLAGSVASAWSGERARAQVSGLPQH